MQRRISSRAGLRGESAITIEAPVLASPGEVCMGRPSHSYVSESPAPPSL